MPRRYCSCCCAACIVSAKVCALGRGEVGFAIAGEGALVSEGYGLFVTPACCGLSSRFASP